MTTNLNTYANVYSPNITSTITSSDWLNLIKGSNSHLETIENARRCKLLYKSTGIEVFNTEYDKLKTSLPAVTYNGLFTDRKSNDNYVSGTGLIYIDIDDISFQIESLDLTKIYSYYRSIGGLGYSLLVRVDDLTLDNFKSTYNYIINDLGLECDDTNAVKPTQYSILSYDPDIYINDNSFVFNTINEVLPINNHFVPNPPVRSLKKKHNLEVGYKMDNTPLIYNNMKSFNFGNNELIQDWDEGIDYIECVNPFRQVKDGRKRIMINYIRNLVWLNPNAKYDRIYNSAKSVNSRISENPLPIEKIKEFVDLVIKQLNNGSLTPKITKRRILLNPANLLLKEEKTQLIGAAMAAMYADKGSNRLYEIIEDWNFEFNGKLSIRNVAVNSNMNIKTVAKYWNQVQDFVKDLNQANALIIKAYNKRKSIINKDIKEDNLVQLVEDMDVLTIQEQALIEHPTDELIDENYINDEDLIFLDPDIF